MEKKITTRFYSIAFLICIFLLSTSIPFALFIKNDEIIYWINITLKICFLIYAFYYIKKNDLIKFKTEKLSLKCFSFIPLLLICISNFIVVWYNKISLNDKISTYYILKELLLCFLVSFSEELIFRSVLFEEFLIYKKPLLAIIYSSLIFGGIHLLNIGSIGDIFPCIIQSLYSFGIGLILSMIYYFSKNLILPITLHFLFNFLNDSLVTHLFNFNWDTSFYIINFAVTFIILIYTLTIFCILNKKEIK